MVITMTYGIRQTMVLALLALPLYSTRLQTNGLSSGSLSFPICEMDILSEFLTEDYWED